VGKPAGSHTHGYVYPVPEYPGVQVQYRTAFRTGGYLLEVPRYFPFLYSGTKFTILVSFFGTLDSLNMEYDMCCCFLFSSIYHTFCTTSIYLGYYCLLQCVSMVRARAGKPLCLSCKKGCTQMAGMRRGVCAYKCAMCMAGT
jgi:hypothetical protein